MIKKIILNIGAAFCFAFIGIILLFVGYEALLFYAHDMNPDYALIDRCLGLGGEWDYEAEKCVS